MSRQSTARYSAQASAQPEANAQQDAFDQDFLRDQLEALLASPTLARVADRHSEGHDDPAEFDAGRARDTEREFELTDDDGDDEDERDTQPTVDTQLLREALRAGLK